MQPGGIDLVEAKALLGLGEDVAVTVEAVKRAYLQKSYALIRSGAPEAERARLKSAEAALMTALAALEKEKMGTVHTAARETRAARAAAAEERGMEEALREAARLEPTLGPYD